MEAPVEYRSLPRRNDGGRASFVRDRVVGVACALFLGLGIAGCDADRAVTADGGEATRAESTAPESPASEGPKAPRVVKLDPSKIEPRVVEYPYPPTEEQLKSGFDSSEELAWVALRAIDQRDRRILDRLRVDRETYEQILWPSFEAEKIANTVPVETAWGLLDMQSRSGVSDLMSDYGGLGLEFRRLTIEIEKDYVEFKLLRRPEVIVKDPETGGVAPIVLFKDIVEIDGKYQLVAYPS